MYSVDGTFGPTGTVSGIEWWEDFEYYLQLFTEGLQKKKPSILNIFHVWDRKFYPNSEDGLAGGVDSDDEGAEDKRATLEEMNVEEPEGNSNGNGNGKGKGKGKGKGGGDGSEGKGKDEGEGKGDDS
ncbi:hypothetical protein B0H17DRAFT_1149957 [Mycena rosella]|uniref:Uncharacterized protein n=1 Tax=Mycena rosella TaxID=1033263 RepID=A0AAD7BVG4_MYCRO|nr:hypothetical protein B0H17DRAFT_1149957 [Mycena rosella]